MVSLYPQPTPEYLGSYEVSLLTPEGVRVALLQQFENLEYTIATNGMGYHGWGGYRISGAAEKMERDEWHLDRILSVRRMPPTMDTFYPEFDGIHRLRHKWYQDQKFMFESQGTDLRALLKRRKVLPATGQAFVRRNDHFTDIMRYLVENQAGPSAGVNAIPYLVVEADTHEGDVGDLVFRYEALAGNLETLSGLGADFDIEREGGEYTFRVHFPYHGTDHRVGNTLGNVPVHFALDHYNMKDPDWTEDRTEEKTVVYVLGEGVGANRQVLEVLSLYDDQLDSVWNRITDTVEASKEVGSGSLLLQGHAFLIENMTKISLGFTALPTEDCLYGVHWKTGDFVTVTFDDATYHMRIAENTITLDGDQHETIAPKLVFLPEIQDDWNPA